jgi:hypothetical protein
VGSAPDATPLVNATKWDETPIIGAANALITPMVGDQAPSGASRKRSRWDLTPAPSAASSAITTTPSISALSTTTSLSGDLVKALSLERDMETRNRPWSRTRKGIS